MHIAKLKTFGLSCLYFLFVVFSASVNAAGLDEMGSGVSIEGWLSAGSQNLPILIFEEPTIHDEILEDIRVENVIVDADGSTRFQLTHSGPMSRQAFAHVRRLEQDDGYTRSIITNIADGNQMEYLTRTADHLSFGKFDKNGENRLLTQKALGDDQTDGCPWCFWLGVLIADVSCAATTTNAHYQCRLNCQDLGGVKSFDSGVCGVYNSECKCMIDPKRTAIEF